MRELKSNYSNDGEPEKKVWKTERIAMVMISVFIFSSLFVLFGFVPFSKKSIGSVKDGIKVEFPAYLRYKKEIDLKFTIFPHENDSFLQVSINKFFLKNMVTKSISPIPSETFIGQDDYTFFFKIAEKSTPIDVIFNLQPKTLGNCQLLVGSKKSKLKELEVYVYP
jgi:hypothetical protein